MVIGLRTLARRSTPDAPALAAPGTGSPSLPGSLFNLILRVSALMEIWRREMSPGPRQVNPELMPVSIPIKISNRSRRLHVDELRTCNNRYEERVGG
jgi:hypothetical protein